MSICVPFWFFLSVLTLVLLKAGIIIYVTAKLFHAVAEKG